MAYRYTADLNTSGSLQTLSPGILVVSCTVRNRTTAIIRLTDARGGVFTTQPGSSNTFDISPSTQFTYQSSAAATGGAQVVFSDAPLPNETTSQSQPPGSVSISAGTVTVESGSVIVTSMPPVTGTVGMIPGTTIGLTPGNTVGLVPGTGITVNNDVTDPVARAYLAALQGLLPQSLQTFTYSGAVGAGPNAERTYVLPNAVTSFSLGVLPATDAYAPNNMNDGNLWVFYSIGGARIYLDSGTYWQEFYTTNNEGSKLPVWFPIHEYIPAGATLGVGWEAHGTILVRV